MNTSEKEVLRAVFRPWLKENEPLARYTSARIGGPAEFFAMAESADELAEMVRTAWQVGAKVFILGGGSNVLVSDAGVRGLVLLNRARAVEFRESLEPPMVRAESGVSLGVLARQCGLRGLGGLEWAGTVPGTVGGAVYGNAGAYGGFLASHLRMAEILQPDGTVRAWSPEELGLGYRTSALKIARPTRSYVVLAAELALTRSDPDLLQARVEEFVSHRKRTQPPGASIGSMFKNPPHDYAGRLIEAVGLKGRRIGNAEISTRHANFFVNLGEARAADVFALIHLAHEAVKAKFGVDLELEVELVGEWGGQC
ncbi:MAG: UDP-N-acetylmuramate dehydrogenase [Anaerolineales bacterium]